MYPDTVPPTYLGSIEEYVMTCGDLERGGWMGVKLVGTRREYQARNVCRGVCVKAVTPRVQRRTEPHG